MSKVIAFQGVTSLNGDPLQVLDRASAADLESVVVVGMTNDGDFYFASSQPDAGEVGYLMDRAKHKLMRVIDHMEENE